MVASFGQGDKDCQQSVNQLFKKSAREGPDLTYTASIGFAALIIKERCQRRLLGLNTTIAYIVILCYTCVIIYKTQV